jgi:pyruvate formate-lyase activating enzyme-like uncharacterized protein
MIKKELISKVKETKNPYFMKDILTMFLKKEIFLKKIYSNIEYLWVEKSDENERNDVIEKIRGYSDTFIDERSKDIYYKARSVGCTLCTLWKWVTVVLSYKCHRDCFFCYEETPLDPQVIIDPYDKKDMDRIYSMVDNALSDPSNKTLAITWWEPFLFTDKIYEILEYVNANYKDINTRIYTTWDIMNENILKNLKKLKLSEIRYSIKPYERPKLELFKLTKKYIKDVLIEMPVQPNSKEYMIDILTEINEAWDIDWINLNELTFNNLNRGDYKKAWYKLDLPDSKSEVYHRYFDVPKIELWVSWSKSLCLDLIEYFSNRKAKFFMHYCDLDTVSHHHYLHKKQVAESFNIPYTTITKYSLNKVLRIYNNLDKCLNVMVSKNKIDFYNTWNYIETSIENIELFKDKWFLVAIIYKTFDNKSLVDFEIINI